MNYHNRPRGWAWFVLAMVSIMALAILAGCSEGPNLCDGLKPRMRAYLDEADNGTPLIIIKTYSLDEVARVAYVKMPGEFNVPCARLVPVVGPLEMPDAQR